MSHLQWRIGIIFPAVTGLIVALMPIRLRYHFLRSHGKTLTSWWVVTDVLQVLIALICAAGFIRVETQGFRDIFGHYAHLYILYLLFAINALWLASITRQSLPPVGGIRLCNLLVITSAIAILCSIAMLFSLPNIPVKVPQGATLGWHGVWDEIKLAWE